MSKTFLSCLTLILLAAPPPAYATAFTLGCSGLIKRTEDPKGSVAGDEKKENVEDMSLIIDLDRRTVSGFWSQGNIGGPQTLVPIISTDSNGVTFEARRGEEGAVLQTIRGTVDRITGKVDALETSISKNNTLYKSYDLRCKRTKPLF